VLAVALTVDQGDVGVVGELVEEGGDRGGVGEYGVPVSKREVRGDEQGAAGDVLVFRPLVASIDDLVEQVGGVGVVGEIADLVDLCGAPHKSTHVEHLVMWSEPQVLRSGLSLRPPDST
jgi:hypothetical protein